MIRIVGYHFLTVYITCPLVPRIGTAPRHLRHAGLRIDNWTLGEALTKCDSLKRGRPLKNVQFRSRSRRMRILTTGIYSIFRGLKSECNAEIGRKGTFCKGLRERKDG